MFSEDQEKFRLWAWNLKGDLIVDHPVRRRTIAISGRPDSDIHLGELGHSTIFVKVGKSSGAVLYQSSDGADNHVRLTFGHPTQVGALTLMIANEDSNTLTMDRPPKQIASSDYSGIIFDIARMMSKPMVGQADLRGFIGDYLKLLIERTPAQNGMVVAADSGGFSLVGSFGLDDKKAHKLWEKMPHNLAQDILRKDARVLLPDQLKKKCKPDTTVFVTGVKSVAGFPAVTEGRVVAIVYLGFDNLLKGLSEELQNTMEVAADLLGIVIQRACLREQLQSIKLAADSTAKSHMPAGRIMVGGSEKLADVYKLITRLAPVDVPVLVQGETGTGKELVAKELHRMSMRSAKPYVVVNAAALPETLIESELFGHAKGAFTGAFSDRKGLVEQADGGTLFIDEIGELTLPLQSKLLRVLQERALNRIGDTVTRQVDFRLIAATHRDLNDMLDKGLFREDLYYRIAGAVIQMPPLRARKEDIIPLANYFKQMFARRHELPEKEWSRNALVKLESSQWPGNIRQLENIVARACVMAEGPIIRSNDLDLEAEVDSDGTGDEQGVSLNEAKDLWMRKFLSRALQRHNGRRTETAKALGIGERTLFRYIEQYEIRD